jgi:TonB-dependent Receptor Plug Domain.
MRKQFIIKRATIFLFFSMLCIISFAQSITGTVKDESGEAVIGANVVVKGTTNGTITDFDGNFTIQGVKASDVLSVSYIGYLSKEIKVGSQKSIQIVLEPDTKTLDEVVVIGYGAVKKSDLTSSISTVKSKQITEVTTGNAMDALQGKVNGVQVMSGGGPSATPKVLIRVLPLLMEVTCCMCRWNAGR